MKKTNLKEYIDELRVCQDSKRLKDELIKYADNWPILFFGEGNNIFDIITTDMEKTLESHDLFSGTYILLPEHTAFEGINRPVRKCYNYEAGTINIQVYRIIDTLYIGDEHKMNGQDHSLWVSLHPYQEKRITGLDTYQAMAQVIVDIGEYILKKGIFTVRLPKDGLQIYHNADID